MDNPRVAEIRVRDVRATNLGGPFSFCRPVGRKEAMNINQVSGSVIDSAIRVHMMLGPGLLESAYQAFLRHELIKRGRSVCSEVALPVVYEGCKLDVAFRLDLLVDNLVVVEVKAVENLIPVHEAQLLSYLKLGGFKLGLLINFNSLRLKDGIRRMVNNL